MSTPNGTDTTMSSQVDLETAALLTASVERILEDLCTPSLLREAEGAGGASATAAVWRALEDAGLTDALRADGDPSEGLGWGEVRAMIEACGHWGLPAPLPESLAAQALARLAGAQLPQGPCLLAVARVVDGRVTAETVALPQSAKVAVCSLPMQGTQCEELWLFETARADRAPVTSVAVENARMTWSMADGLSLGRLPDGASALSAGAAVRSAQIAGACRRVLEMATQYANDRVQFGRPIGKFQAIQQQLSLASEWAVMAGMASQLALAGPGLVLDPVRVASAKQVAGDAAQICTEVAHAVHAAIGVTREYDLQLFSRRLWTWASEFGSSLYWARTLGNELVAHAPKYSWDTVVRASTFE
jgi:acyl-CoA dehydrogenase